MSAQRGSDLLLKISDGGTPPSFTTLAGLRTRTISLNARSVDVTDGDSLGRWRELLGGAAVRQISVSGTGIFRDAPSDALMRASFFAQSSDVWRLILPGFGQLEGPFQIASLDYAGDFDGEATFALTLSSAGAITFLPL